METELHGTLKVSSEQGLCDESIHIWQEIKNVFHNHQTLQIVLSLLLNVIFNRSNKKTGGMWDSYLDWCWGWCLFLLELELELLWALWGLEPRAQQKRTPLLPVSFCPVKPRKPFISNPPLFLLCEFTLTMTLNWLTDPNSQKKEAFPCLDNKYLYCIIIYWLHATVITV